EVNIGLFPDVGGSYFLARAPGQLGTYLGVTGETIGAADALYAGLADVYIPSAELAALEEALVSSKGDDARSVVRTFAAQFAGDIDATQSMLAVHRARIDQHFSHDKVDAIFASLSHDDADFAQKTLQVMAKRSPLMMCVTLEQLRRGASMGV